MDQYPIAGGSCSPLESQDADLRATAPGPAAINDAASGEAEKDGVESQPDAALGNKEEQKSTSASSFRDDGGNSLPAMATRELDATLQLLVERTQYITGATGAAIALKDSDGMLCRASAGASSPELGAQLQVNSGLSGESVRTRQILRCDDAETDARVNRDSCRALGIASVVIMPLLRDGEVEGVFELFSDKTYTFGARDIATLERMGEMVHTAIDHARAAHTPLKQAEPDKTGVRSPDTVDGKGTVDHALADDRIEELETTSVTESDTIEEAVPSREPTRATEHSVVFWGPRRHSAQGPSAAQETKPTQEKPSDMPDSKSTAAADGDILPGVGTEPAKIFAVSETGFSLAPETPPEVEAVSPSEKTTGLRGGVIAEAPANATNHESCDPSGINPEGFVGGTANIHKCEGCGFPVSEGRKFCLDCDSASKGNDPAMAAVSRGVPAEPARFIPQFLSGIESTGDESWLAAHKYLIAALVALALIIIFLLLSRSS